MTNLSVNAVLAWYDENNSIVSVERVLWISGDRTTVVVIDVSSIENWPYFRDYQLFEDGFQNGSVRRLAIDPYAKFMRLSDTVKKEHLAIRDKAWCVIHDIICVEPDIYDERLRKPLIKNACDTSGKHRRHIHRLLKKYWVRGKIMNALLPDFDNCGAPGIERYSKNDVKLGRPSEVGKEDPELIGVNASKTDRKNISLYIKRHYIDPKEYTFEVVYQLMLEEKYAIGVKFENGRPKPILADAHTVPSFVQFRYHGNKELSDLRHTLEKRMGTRNYALTKRPLLGNATIHTFGPGSLWEIDSTVTNTYLVSRLDRNRIVGRLVVYLVKDVFSRLTAGIYAGLDGPSWVGAMQAIENATTDKVSFCQRYGIEIEEEDWPCHYLPAAIKGDRGEMESKNADRLVESLGVRVDNTAAYRADTKPFIESHFGKTEGQIDPWTPGSVRQRFRERGEPDYRLAARLTSDELTKVLILATIQHNKSVVEDYPLTAEMMRDGVRPIPIELWHWGVANGMSSLHELPHNVVRLNLMPRGKASVDRHGIYFAESKMFYHAEGLLERGWYDKAVRQGRWQVQISYDPRNTDYIYVIDPDGDGSTFVKCKKLPKYDGFTGYWLEEIRDQRLIEKTEDARDETAQRQLKADRNAQIRDIVTNANELTEAAMDPNQSNASRLKGIRPNRGEEKELERKERKWDVDVDGLTVVGDINTSHAMESAIENYNMPDDDEETEVRPRSVIGLLQKKHSERWEAHE